MASGTSMHRARRTSAALCLAALALAPAGALLAADTGKTPFIELGTGQQPGRVDAEGAAPDTASLGGALYNPFSPTFETAASTARVASQAPQQRGGGRPGLVTTAVAALIAAGCLGVLVRLLVAG
ncbi:hypothetical protein H4CHR_05894 [Variovorax sp. PBS-H4]|uniref:hypothetical protein n=1 Tax=Variovorax sp. PBS-H4 TaxID=434008 RepID=UPI0013198810|nr:hypothetical protein [Variovorax sp. PBS-H4]VTU41159.1 hypothetical protein H4CHR_05894 [Variovorax sp. PBS-H4]